MDAAVPPRLLGRYVLHDEFASGGMATVHLGRRLDAPDGAPPVAIKRLHDQFARDPEFLAMFLDEARIAARVVHPNVVQTHEVLRDERELWIVMEYIAGASLDALQTLPGEPLPLDVALSLIGDVCRGLHAAHEARDDAGQPLGLVHRDVSPQNILVGTDGVARVVDFGIAKASGRAARTREGQFKGKLAYAAPEQVQGLGVDRRADVYAVGVVLHECLTGQRLRSGDSEVELLFQVLEGSARPPSQLVPGLPPALDDVLARALARSPAERFDTTLALAEALDRLPVARSPETVARWLAARSGAPGLGSLPALEPTPGTRVTDVAPGPEVPYKEATLSLASAPASLVPSASAAPPGALPSAGPRRWARPAVALLAGLVLAAAVWLLPRASPSSSPAMPTRSAPEGTSSSSAAPVVSAPVEPVVPVMASSPTPSASVRGAAPRGSSTRGGRPSAPSTARTAPTREITLY